MSITIYDNQLRSLKKTKKLKNKSYAERVIFETEFAQSRLYAVLHKDLI